jgi:hypothetical protein
LVLFGIIVSIFTSVTERQREFVGRLALGARLARVRRLVLRQVGAKLTGGVRALWPSPFGGRRNASETPRPAIPCAPGPRPTPRRRTPHAAAWPESGAIRTRSGPSSQSSSGFTFCTGALHLSEQAAYARIEAARLVRRFPQALDLLRDSSVNVTTLGLVAPHLTTENAVAVFAAIVHKSKREVEHIVAARAPTPAVPSIVRRVVAVPPPPGAGKSAECLFVEQNSATRASTLPAAVAPAAPAQRPVVAPLSPDRYKVQVTLSSAGYEALRGLQSLLRHAIPNGDPARIVERALVDLLERVRRDRLAASAHPRHRVGSPRVGSRHIPAAVKRSVWSRDEGQCAFVGAAGRCGERNFLEFHHVVPFADGGAATAENIQLRCRAHNAFEAQGWDLSAPC